MAKISSKHIENGALRAIQYIKLRREGKEPSLKTRFKKLDKALLGGIPWNKIFSIAGMSGSGKSTLVELLIMDALDNEQDIKVLSFKLEMSPEDEITRTISAKLGIPLKDIYSGEKPLSDEDYHKALSIAKDYAKKPINYISKHPTAKEALQCIYDYVEEEGIEGTNTGLIVTLDHLLLLKGEDEKTSIDTFMKGLIEVKLDLADRGIKALFIVLDQLNRDIEKPERTLNPSLHYPTKNDIFAASSVYYSSDYVLIVHKPALLDGISTEYGPPRKGFPRGLPVYSDDGVPLIYFHLIKERFGKPKVLAMRDELEHSMISEYNLEAHGISSNDAPSRSGN